MNYAQPWRGNEWKHITMDVCGVYMQIRESLENTWSGETQSLSLSLQENVIFPENTRPRVSVNQRWTYKLNVFAFCFLSLLTRVTFHTARKSLIIRDVKSLLGYR